MTLTERQVRDEIADILITWPRLRRPHWKACGCCPTYWPDRAEETAAMRELADLRAALITPPGALCGPVAAQTPETAPTGTRPHSDPFSNV